MNKLSEWQDGHTKPVLAGVYQRDYSSGIRYCYFSNGIWYLNADSVEEAKAYYFAGKDSLATILPWRGIIDE